MTDTEVAEYKTLAQTKAALSKEMGSLQRKVRQAFKKSSIKLSSNAAVVCGKLRVETGKVPLVYGTPKSVRLKAKDSRSRKNCRAATVEVKR